jgi:hypothetical protein
MRQEQDNLNNGQYVYLPVLQHVTRAGHEKAQRIRVFRLRHLRLQLVRHKSNKEHNVLGWHALQVRIVVETWRVTVHPQRHRAHHTHQLQLYRCLCLGCISAARVIADNAVRYSRGGCIYDPAIAASALIAALR